MKKITVPAVKRRLARYRQGARAALIERLEGGGHLEAPVDFRAWLKRRAGRKASGFPDAWRVDPQLEISEPAKVAVLLHVFFPELVPEILARLGNIPVAYDLFITNASGEDVRVPPGIANMRNVAVLKVDNRGRDIFPSVQVVNSGALDPYELILKVHTKRSAWREGHTDLAGDGAQWKDSFLDALLGSESKVKAILSAFAADPDLGQVTAPGSVLGPEFWGADQLITAELLRRLELDLEPDALRFCAGSMYWTRAFVLQGLRALNLTR
ncbi:MAG: glycosyl transferase family 2, partial [Actinobacteria bacterium]|nr:glycosyl transferase family 2 [Actinomycetota bacterium]